MTFTISFAVTIEPSCPPTGSPSPALTMPAPSPAPRPAWRQLLFAFMDDAEDQPPQDRDVWSP